MNRKGKMMALLTAAVMLVALAPLAAQTSKTNDATAGIFETDVDNFMDVTDYSTVEMEKQFGYIGYNGLLELGYARKLGGMQFGTYYNGNILYTNDNSEDNVDVRTTDTIANGVISSTTTQTTESFTNPAKYFNNKFDMLAGIAGMGFKLKLRENLNISDKLDTANNQTVEDTSNGSKHVIEYTDVSVTNGTVAPGLDWGMRLPVGSMILKPNVSLDCTIDLTGRKYTKNEYTEINGQKSPTATDQTTTVDNRYGNLWPSASLGCGFESTGDKGVKKEAFVSYTFDMGIYSNEYENGFGSKESVSGTVVATKTEKVDSETLLAKETSVKVEAVIDEISEMNHGLRAELKRSREVSDRFEFGYRGALNVTFKTKNVENKSVDTTRTNHVAYDQNPANDWVEETTRTYDQSTEETSEMNVMPYISTGMKYKAIPDVLSFNGGLYVNLPAFMRKVETKTVKDSESSITTRTTGNGTVTRTSNGGYENATVIRNEYEYDSIDWDALGASVSAGLTLNVTPKVAVDAIMSSGGGALAFTIDATSLTVACTIKQ